MSGHVWFTQSDGVSGYKYHSSFVCVPAQAPVSISQESSLSQWLNLNTETHGWKKKKKKKRKLLAGLAAPLTVKMDTTAGMSHSLWSAEGRRQALNAMAVVSQLKTSRRRKKQSRYLPLSDLT